MYYFDASGTPPSPQTTCDIAPGGMVAYSLMGSGGIPSATCASGTTVTNTPIPIGWQGYGIAMCNFQYGHGMLSSATATFRVWDRRATWL